MLKEKMMMDSENSASPLQLSYIFSPNPNPIRASVSGGNPQVVDLEIIISNPLVDSVEIDEINIEIPMGADNARSLSAAPKLPQPDNKTSGPWTIKADEAKIVITPTDGKSGQFKGEVVIFKLKGIQVNNTPGAAPITITEYSGSDSADDTYQLSKLEADFPVTKFYADPDVLYNYDKVKFFWTCSDQGKNYKYSVYPRRTQPRDCRDGQGECKSCADGSAGVQSARLEKTTTFNLDVLKAESAGRYSIYKTLTTTVRVEMPYFHQDYEWVESASGRLLQLGWVAENASKCVVEFDNKVIDNNAPTNTGGQNYVIMNNDKPGTYPVKLTATSKDGKRKASLSLSNANVADPIVLNVGNVLGKVEVTPDGKLGLLLDGANQKIVVVDLPGKALKSTIPIPERSLTLALTPDGKYALMGGASIRVLDTGTLQLLPNAINVGKISLEIVFTPDSKQAFANNPIERCITVIDMATFKVSKTFPYGSMQTMAFNITPDGKYILMMIAASGTGVTYFRVIDANKLEFVGEPVQVGLCTLICPTPDSKYALASDFMDASVRVIDIASRKLVRTINHGFAGPALTIAPIPGTKFVLAGGADTDRISLINLDTFAAKVMWWPINIGPFGITVTPDGMLLINSLMHGLKFF
jgi:DNA-binding beta-propeller fold protein YncE